MNVQKRQKKNGDSLGTTIFSIEILKRDRLDTFKPNWEPLMAAT
jgi:hypothetical protein